MNNSAAYSSSIFSMIHCDIGRADIISAEGKQAHKDLKAKKFRQIDK